MNNKRKMKKKRKKKMRLAKLDPHLPRSLSCLPASELYRFLP
jgi:hypothetical protein